MLAYLTLVSLLFLAISISNFNILNIYFYTSFCAFSESTGYFQIFATHLKAQSEKRDSLHHVIGELKQLV